MVACLSDATANDAPFMTEARHGTSKLMAKVGQVGTADVAQFDSLEVVPDALIRIDVRRVARQGFEMDALRTACGQELPDEVATMDGGAIPNHEQFALDVPQEMFEETDNVLAIERPILHQEQQPLIWGDTADGRKMIACQRDAQHRRLSTRGVGTHDPGQQVEAGLIYPDNGAVFLSGFFLIAGQRSAYQAAIAASSRCVARRIGFWGVQPTSRSSRLTCAGWYRTPYSRSITVATRRVVQTSPRKPKASAPRANSNGSCAFCSGGNFGWRPGIGW
jgi:hypothetical protein